MISLDALLVGLIVVFSLELHHCCCSAHQYQKYLAGSDEAPERFLLFVFLMLYKVDSPHTGMKEQQKYHDVYYALLLRHMILLFPT